jgi:ferrous iron transport protein B
MNVTSALQSKAFVPTTAQGMVEDATKPAAIPFSIDYGHDVENAIEELTTCLSQLEALPANWGARWTAIKLLEDDYEVVTQVQVVQGGVQAVEFSRQQIASLRTIYGDDVDLLIADRRYGYINGLVRQVHTANDHDRLAKTERIDAIVTHRWLGLPIFLFVMYMVFRMVIDVSAPFLDWVDFVMTGPVSNWATRLLTFAQAPEWLHSLVLDGVIAGVGAVLVFVPGLMVLYFFLAVLEDSGYMSRAAFVMDRFMRYVGLHGKSFIPLVLGFGCGVPAIYATRTLPSQRDRVLTALLVPFMSCSARLPVYVVFGMAFFGAQAGTAIWMLYAGGIVLAMAAAWLYTHTILKPDQSSHFILEMPPYRQPQVRGLFIHMWENTRQFVRKAWTIILGVSIIMWLLMNLPMSAETTRDSYYGRVSAAAAPVFAPLGFGEWQSTGALISGFVAKEVVVSTLAQVYAAEAGISDMAEEDAYGPTTLMEDVGYILTGFATATVDSVKTLLSIVPGINLVGDNTEDAPSSWLTLALQRHFSTASAIAFLVFVLVYVPCITTIAAMRKEFGGKWALFSAVYQTALAWVLAFVVYRVALLVLA